MHEQRRQPERSIDDPPELRFESPVMGESEEREFDRWREMKDEKMSDEDQIKHLLGVLRARALAAEEKVARLRLVIQKLLMSADCTWEERREGHDWAEACAEARLEIGIDLKEAAIKEQHHEDAGRDS
jgi:hypothetical protein